MRAITEKIKELRYKKGLSQENMAYELHITQPAYAKIENNKTTLSVDRLFEIARILEVLPIEIFNASSIFHQHNTEDAIDYQQKIESLYRDNKSVQESLIKALQEEVAFLKQLLERIENQNT